MSSYEECEGCGFLVEDCECQDFACECCGAMSCDCDLKPKILVDGIDGNVFAIIGAVCRTLKKAGLPEQAKEFKTKAMAAPSYGSVLTMTNDYVRWV